MKLTKKEGYYQAYIYEKGGPEPKAEVYLDKENLKQAFLMSCRLIDLDTENCVARTPLLQLICGTVNGVFFTE